MESRWQTLGTVSPRALVEARLLLHHASQLVAAVGRCLVPARPDDGHTSLEWLPQASVLAGQAVPGPRPWRAALEPAGPTLLVLADGARVATLELAGRTRAEAFGWLVHEAEGLGADPGALRLAAPYAIPAHAVEAGGPFAAGAPDALAELGRWFADGDHVLRALAGRWPGSAPVRVWPHHFDAGSVLPLDGGPGKDAATLGVGLSPGDDEIPEPYLYVTLWPPPEPAKLPGLREGSWHSGGWTGAVLAGSEVVAAGAGEQEGLAGRFLAEASATLRAWHASRAR